MRNQNSTPSRSDADYVGVGQTNNTAIMGVQEIDRWPPPAKARNDPVAEIGIPQANAASCRGRMSPFACLGKLPVESRIVSPRLFSNAGVLDEVAAIALLDVFLDHRPTASSITPLSEPLRWLATRAVNARY